MLSSKNNTPQDNLGVQIMQQADKKQTSQDISAEEARQIENSQNIGTGQKMPNKSDLVQLFRLSKLLKYYFGSDDCLVLQNIFSNMKRASMAQELYQQANEKKLTSGFDKRISDISKAVLDYDKNNEDFNCDELSNNPQFLRYLWELGLDVGDAHLLCDKQKIKDDAIKNAQESIMSSILAKGKRICENGVMKGQAGKKSKVRASSLNNSDIDDILSRVKRGERITF